MGTVNRLRSFLSPGHSVTRSLGHSVNSVTWSLGHSVNWSLGHSVTWSLGHSVTWSHGHLVIWSLFSTLSLTDTRTNNIRTYRSASQTTIQCLCFLLLGTMSTKKVDNQI